MINVVQAARGARGYRTDADPAAIGSPSSRRRRTTATVTPTVEHVRMISLAPRRTHAGRPYLPAITPVVANRAGGGGGVGVAMETPRSRERGGGRVECARSRHARAGGGGGRRSELDGRRCPPSSGHDGKQVEYDAHPPAAAAWSTRTRSCAGDGDRSQAESLSDDRLKSISNSQHCLQR